MATPIYCKGCETVHDPLKPCPPKAASASVKPKPRPAGPSSARTKAAPVPTQRTKAVAPAAPKSAVIVVTRDRAAYNSYQRDYKKAARKGLTVAEYRARKT